MDVIKRINDIMKNQGMTRYQLAKISGLSQSTLSNMNTRNTTPSIPTIEMICNALNISLSQFFAGDNEYMYPVDYKQKELLDLFIMLDNEQQDAILNVARHMYPKKDFDNID